MSGWARSPSSRVFFALILRVFAEGTHRVTLCPTDESFLFEDARYASHEDLERKIPSPLVADRAHMPDLVTGKH